MPLTGRLSQKVVGREMRHQTTEFRHRAFSDRPATVTRRIDIDHGLDYNLPVVADVGCIFVDLYPTESQGDRHENTDADAAISDRNCRSTR